MRRLVSLFPLLALAGCPNNQQVHLLTDAAPRTDAIRCAAARMASLGYVVPETAATTDVTATKREGELETTLQVRLFIFERTGVRRLSVRANQVRHSGQGRVQSPGVSREARVDAEAVIRSCGTREPGAAGAVP